MDFDILISIILRIILGLMISLFIAGIPRPKQSARFCRMGKFIKSYQPKEVVQNENNIRAIIISQLPEGFVPYARGVLIKKLHYIFPPLKGFSKKLLERIATETVYKTTKPDLSDNLQKATFDAMKGVVFLDDSLICSMDNVKKYYGFTPGISIELEELPE